MKQFAIYSLLAFLLIGMTTTSVEAQEFAYVNSSAILSEMPEVKQADANLQALRKQLQKKGEQRLQNLRSKYEDLARKEEQGEIAPKTLQAEAEKLKQEEMELQQYEQDMKNQIQEKRQELMEPILDRVQKAIDEVADEEGFTYVFDSSTGVLLYADDSRDISDKVRAKLNL